MHGDKPIAPVSVRILLRSNGQTLSTDSFHEAIHLIESQLTYIP